MFESLRSISDHDILSQTDRIAAQDRKLTLQLLLHLCEIERRKLHLKHGYSSMFDYCIRHLRFSEPAAARRIRTARCVARFPELRGLLESGEVNLMSVSLISRVLKPENAGTLIARIRGKSKREVEMMVSESEPRTSLPPDRVRPITVAAPVENAARSFTVTGDSEKTPRNETLASGERGTNGHEDESVARHECEARRMPLDLTVAGRCETRLAIHFTARKEFMTKLERARALVSHQLPGATFEQLFELALDELIRRRDRKPSRESVATAPPARAGKRYIPAAVRDQVFSRDGFRCAFVAPDGRRCTSMVALQVDHVRPVARGGASTMDNLRILCAQHNRLEAERLMGHCGSRERVY